MPFPYEFDQNEWFVLIGLVVAYTAMWIAPKRFPLSITILIMMFSILSARLSDHLMASPKFDLYSIMDSSNYDLFDLFLYFLYGPFGYFFIYLYDIFGIKGYGIFLFILGGSFFAVGFEWMNVYFNVFTYNSWESRYSFGVYLIVQSLTLLFYHFIRKRYEPSPPKKS